MIIGSSGAIATQLLTEANVGMLISISILNPFNYTLNVVPGSVLATMNYITLDVGNAQIVSNTPPNSNL